MSEASDQVIVLSDTGLGAANGGFNRFGKVRLVLRKKDLRTTPAMEIAAPRTTASEANVMMDTGKTISVVRDADLLSEIVELDSINLHSVHLLC